MAREEAEEQASPSILRSPKPCAWAGQDRRGRSCHHRRARQISAHAARQLHVPEVAILLRGRPRRCAKTAVSSRCIRTNISPMIGRTLAARTMVFARCAFHSNVVRPFLELAASAARNPLRSEVLRTAHYQLQRCRRARLPWHRTSTSHGRTPRWSRDGSRPRTLVRSRGASKPAGAAWSKDLLDAALSKRVNTPPGDSKFRRRPSSFSTATDSRRRCCTSTGKPATSVCRPDRRASETSRDLLLYRAVPSQSLGIHGP